MSAGASSSAFLPAWEEFDSPAHNIRFEELGEADIHIWLLPLDLGEGRRSEVSACLEPEERARAGRFRFDRDRNRFLVRRALSRMIIGAYLDAEPSSLVFVETEAGKPSLSGRHGAVGLAFNRSVSEGYCLLAVGRDEAMGVDIEACEPRGKLDLVAKDHFADGELATLAAFEGEDWLEAFYCCWTRKEAVVKAMGDGLLAPLQDFEVTTAPHEPAKLMSMNGSEMAASEWTLLGFRPVPGHWAALAVRRPDISVRYLSFPQSQNA